MKKFTLIALVAMVIAGMAITSCKAAGGGSAKGDGGKKEASGGSDTEATEDGCYEAGEITFKYIPSDGEEPEEVFLAGDFNGWNPSDPNYQMEQNDDGEFEIEIELDPGTYKFKTVIDGQWPGSMEELKDNVKPTIETFVDDGFGGANAVIEICE